MIAKVILIFKAKGEVLPDPKVIDIEAIYTQVYEKERGNPPIFNVG